MANINQMNESARKLLEEITSKDLLELTVYDIGFMKARNMYLTHEQKETYKDALDGKVKGVDYVAPKDKVEEEISAKPTGEVKEVNPDDFKLNVLQQMAKDAGLEFTPEMTKRELADLLNAR